MNFGIRNVLDLLVTVFSRAGAIVQRFLRPKLVFRILVILNAVYLPRDACTCVSVHSIDEKVFNFIVKSCQLPVFTDDGGN